MLRHCPVLLLTLLILNITSYWGDLSDATVETKKTLLTWLQESATSFQTKFPPSTSNSVAGLPRESTTPSHNNSMFPLADSAHMGVGRRSTEASYSLSSESRPPTNTRAARSNNNNNNNARRPSAESTYPRNPAASACDWCWSR